MRSFKVLEQVRTAAQSSHENNALVIVSLTPVVRHSGCTCSHGKTLSNRLLDLLFDKRSNFVENNFESIRDMRADAYG